MKRYHVIVTDDAKRDIRRYMKYLEKYKKNNQAAKNLAEDYRNTRKELEIIAGSLRDPDSDILKARKLKRLNFLRHDYFLLFRIEGRDVFITDIFHALEDFENKLS